MTVAVRVQLYSTASSPNTLPGPSSVNLFPLFVTSTQPSVQICTHVDHRIYEHVCSSVHLPVLNLAVNLRQLCNVDSGSNAMYYQLKGPEVRSTLQFHARSYDRTVGLSRDTVCTPPVKWKTNRGSYIPFFLFLSSAPFYRLVILELRLSITCLITIVQLIGTGICKVPFRILGKSLTFIGLRLSRYNVNVFT